jgi:hypothetical protein
MRLYEEFESGFYIEGVWEAGKVEVRKGRVSINQ